MLKRLFDIVFSFIGLFVFSPLFIIIALLIKLDSKGPILYKANRVGKKEKLFTFLKFRTMKPNSDKSAITVGDNDNRITRVGIFLRKSKLDELPQLLNVLKGDISFVGPRPDVGKYINDYKKHFIYYYEMKPGITSYSSIFFTDESQLYVNVANPEKKYIEYTIPKKVELDKTYYENTSVLTDIKIIIKTITHIISR